MWTYSAESLSAWSASIALAETLHPTDGGSATGERSAPLSMPHLGLTAEDLTNESVLEFLRLEWPQVVDRLLVTSLISRPDVPFYRLDELRAHLHAFRDYLRSERRSLLAMGRPRRPFGPSPWLHIGLSNIFPDQSAFDAVGRGDSAEIVRRELFDNKITVVDFLAHRLDGTHSRAVFDEAIRLAQGTRLPERMVELDELERAHFRNLSDGEVVHRDYTGGYADIVSLIAYWYKETTLRTFDDAKLRLEEVWPSGSPRRYIEVAASPRRAEIDAVLDMLNMSIADERRSYSEFLGDLQSPLLRGLNVRPAPDFVFQKRGQAWSITWSGGEFSMPDIIGMRYLHRLMSSPSKEFRVTDLYLLEHPKEQEQPDDGSGHDMTDEKTTREVDKRLEVIRQRLAMNEPGQEDSLRHEEAQLLKYRSQTTGRLGRPRQERGLDEKRRKSVTNAIRDARDRIREVCPELAEHLDKPNLRTGATCTYMPRIPINWRL